jgi:hypothetical protein
VKHSHSNETTEAVGKRIQELERQIMDLKIANRGKDHFIELMKQERSGFIERLQATIWTLGQLETKLIQVKPTKPNK